MHPTPAAESPPVPVTPVPINVSEPSECDDVIEALMAIVPAARNVRTVLVFQIIEFSTVILPACLPEDTAVIVTLAPACRLLTRESTFILELPSAFVEPLARVEIVKSPGSSSRVPFLPFTDRRLTRP